MRAVSSLRSVATLIAVVLAGACDDTTAPSPPGGIRVLIAASGEDISTRDLRVSVVNGPSRQLDSASFEAVFVGLAPGTHMVRLEGLAANCQVTGANPRPVAVVSEQSTLVHFDVVCAPRMGSVRVTTTTTGVDLDTDGYIAVTSSGVNLPVPSNGTTTLPNVREGQRTITLEEVLSNCAIAGPDTVMVTVPYAGSVDVAFAVECVAFGTLEVTVTTTGVNLDPTGYIIDVRSVSAGFSRVLDVATSGSVTQLHLRPATDYRVELTSLTTNCFVSGAGARTVTVTAGVTTRIAFAVECEALSELAFERGGDIHTVWSDGSMPTPLMTTQEFDGDPSWSILGRIAFTTSRHSDDLELYVMDADGSNQVRLTTSAGADDSPSWSPDGERIVFRSGRNVNSEIYVVNADGSGLTRLTDHDASDTQPAWSSTGKIAFISDRDHPSGEIYVMNPDGSNVVRLTNNDVNEAAPAWSPDGSKIVFSQQVGCYYSCFHDLFVMNADGSDVTRLETAWGSYQHFSNPAWSPNGRAIVFTNQYCGYYYYSSCSAPSLWLLDLQGSGVHLITDFGGSPTWRPR